MTARDEAGGPDPAPGREAAGSAPRREGRRVGRRVGTSYKQTELDGPFDVVLIGSGIGSLTTASMLARHAGLRPLVLERHYTAGGFTHAFHRPGYEWDVGVHYIGEAHREGTLVRRLFDHVSEGALRWEDMGRVYDRVVIDGDTYDFVSGRSAFRDTMVSRFPREAGAIDAYLDLLHRVTGAAHVRLGAGALPGPLARLARLATRVQGGRSLGETVARALGRLTSDRRLVSVLTGQWGDYGLPPGRAAFLMHALVASHYMGGAAYPVGGATEIARTIVDSIEVAGGRVLTNAEVDGVVLEGGRAAGVRLVDGRRVDARYVVSGAGAAVTYGRLLGERWRSPTHRTPSVCHLCLYVGLDRSDAELGLPRANLWVHPNDDADRNFQQVLEHGSRAPFPFLFISFPSAKDPDFQCRYPGRAAIQVATMASWAEWEPWVSTSWHKRGGEYDALKEKLSERLLGALLEHVPEVRGHVAHVELSTPLSTRHFAGHPTGEIYGLAPSPARYRDASLGVRTPVRNLFLTGCDVTGGGVAGAAIGGVITASAIARKDLRKVL